MAFIVTESCIMCKYTDCVSACPVDCFREGPNMLVIAPDECIDCGACVPECPAEAIFNEEDLPADQVFMTKVNKDLAKTYAAITKQKSPMDGADSRKTEKGKYKKYLA